MMNPPNAPGLFIVVEGADGSGKATQCDLLQKRLQDAGHQVEVFDFPRYDQPSSYFITQYLNGKYGSAEKVGPYTGSLFYALDRFEATPAIRKAIADGKIVLANRFTGSNMAHQGGKFASDEERRGYFIWIDNLEFMMLDIPRPDKNFVLRLPADILQDQIDKKEGRLYTNKKRDLHETDLQHLEKSVKVYDDLCQLFPKDFQRIDCVRSGRLLSTKIINDMLWETIYPLLPIPSKQAPSHTPSLEAEQNDFIVTNPDGTKSITKQGKEFLDEHITNSTGNVYAFNDKLSATTVAAAMARLSRRGDDMRVTLLDEFAGKVEKDQQLLHRVITAYGDDSVQQLVGMHVVVEKASNLLTKKLERGRLASYLEQSTRYIYFDKKVDGQYQYFTPEYLDGDVKDKYISTMDRIFDSYSEMVHKLTDYIQANSTIPANERDGAWRSATRAQACDAIRAVLPVATTATVGIYASGQALESLISHLLSDPLPEAYAVGRELLVEARKIIPAFLERVDINERGVATQGYRSFTYQAVKEATNSLLPNMHSIDYETVRLTNFWPRNEIDLVPDMMYAHTNLSLAEITEEVNKLPYGKKLDVFNAYMGERFNRRHKPERALEKVHYSWDLLCDYGIFRDLQRHRMVDDMEWQDLTPRFGYDMPDIVDNAGLGDLYEECFDLSAELYSYMQENNYSLEAQYATLFGHRMRWKVTYNAREAFHLHELRTTPQGHPGYRKLVMQMHQKLAEVHPMLGEAMKFVNQDEDPELTRLAAERYTQAKLQKLDSQN